MDVGSFSKRREREEMPTRAYMDVLTAGHGESDGVHDTLNYFLRMQ